MKLLFAVGLLLIFGSCTIEQLNEGRLSFDAQEIGDALASRGVLASQVSSARVSVSKAGAIIVQKNFSLSDSQVTLAVPIRRDLEIVVEAVLSIPVNGIRSWGFHEIIDVDRGGQTITLDAPLRPLDTVILLPGYDNFEVLNTFDAQPMAKTTNLPNGPFALPIGYLRNGDVLSWYDGNLNLTIVDDVTGTPRTGTSITPGGFYSAASPSWDFSSWNILTGFDGLEAFVRYPAVSEDPMPSTITQNLVNSNGSPFDLRVITTYDGNGDPNAITYPSLSSLLEGKDGYWYLAGNVSYSQNYDSNSFGFILKLRVKAGASRSDPSRWQIVDKYPADLSFAYDQQANNYNNSLNVRDLVLRGKYLYVIDAGRQSGQVAAVQPSLYRLETQGFAAKQASHSFASNVFEPYEFVSRHGSILTIKGERQNAKVLFQVNFDLQSGARARVYGVNEE